MKGQIWCLSPLVLTVTVKREEPNMQANGFLGEGWVGFSSYHNPFDKDHRIYKHHMTTIQ